MYNIIYGAFWLAALGITGVVFIKMFATGQRIAAFGAAGLVGVFFAFGIAVVGGFSPFMEASAHWHLSQIEQRLQQRETKASVERGIPAENISHLGATETYSFPTFAAFCVEETEGIEVMYDRHGHPISWHRVQSGDGC